MKLYSYELNAWEQMWFKRTIEEARNAGMFGGGAGIIGAAVVHKFAGKRLFGWKKAALLTSIPLLGLGGGLLFVSNSAVEKLISLGDKSPLGMEVNRKLKRMDK